MKRLQVGSRVKGVMLGGDYFDGVVVERWRSICKIKLPTGGFEEVDKSDIT